MGNYYRSGYHASYPAWRDTSNLKGKYIGIELEVYNPRGYNKTLEALPNVRKNQRRPLTEEDGSLGDSTGVEIIFPPYKYSQLRNHRSFFHTALAEMQKAGARTASGYGMHMNVNTSDWKPDKLRAFNVTIGSLPSKMIENLGQRSSGCTGTPKWVQYDFGLSSYGRIESKEGRVECRFPQSCLDSERVMLLVDFIALVEKFAGGVKNQKMLQKIVDDTILPNGWDYKAEPRFEQVTAAFTDWLDTQSKKDKSALRVLEVMEKGYDKAEIKQAASEDSGVSAAPAKPWGSNNPDNIGKDGPLSSYSDTDEDCDCDICRGTYDSDDDW